MSIRSTPCRVCGSPVNVRTIHERTLDGSVGGDTVEKCINMRCDSNIAETVAGGPKP